MDRTLTLMLVAALAFTLTACGDEEGGGVIPTVDTGRQDTGVDTGVDVGEPDVGPDVAEDTGPDAEEDMGTDAALPPIDLTGTWVVTRDSDAVEVATLVLEQDGQFIEGTAVMGEAYDSLEGVVSVFVEEEERLVTISWTDVDGDEHELGRAEYSDEMMTFYDSPDGVPNVDVTVMRQSL